jgi:hypothetical protein
MLRQEVGTIEQRRNAEKATIDWQFTVTDIRIKSHRHLSIAFIVRNY